MTLNLECLGRCKASDFSKSVCRCSEKVMRVAEISQNVGSECVGRESLEDVSGYVRNVLRD